MRKIPSLFDRDWSQEIPAQPVVTNGCGWVLDDEVLVVPTVKWDGTCCFVYGRHLYKRRTLEPGERAPTGFVLDTHVRDVPKLIHSGSRHGWVPIDTGDPQDQYHVEGLKNALQMTGRQRLPEGTYELVGPKVQGNPHDLGRHYLWRHGSKLATSFANIGLDYDIISVLIDGIKEEGVVFYELGGQRVVKVKRSDFGLEWPRG